MKANIELSGMN